MTLEVPPSPDPFNASLKSSAPDEAETGSALNASLRRIQETTFADCGHAVRSVHAKSHGLIEGELRVLDDLPEELAQGRFARPGTYPMVLRL